MNLYFAIYLQRNCITVEYTEIYVEYIELQPSKTFSNFPK